MSTSLTADQALPKLGERLIREHEEVPAGAVVRSMARAAAARRESLGLARPRGAPSGDRVPGGA